MIREMMEEYGEQILTVVEVLLVIGLLASLFFSGSVGNIFMEISDAMS